ncbi:MAG: hypothetical protein HY901_19945 [Deltaproteobacteria bacterium]|nr:hypothetical protein [Deltaproteobacteria bacterium]
MPVAPGDRFESTPSSNQAAGTGAGKLLDTVQPDALVSSVLSSFDSSTVVSIDDLQLLTAVNDGTVTLDVPLKAGKHDVKGISFEIKPGTVAHVEVEVSGGKLVPARDRDGSSTGRGCKVDIRPPVDLPLWLSGNGAYLRDRGAAQGAFKADIGGFFDINVQKTDLDLASVVRSLTTQKPESSGSAMPPGLFDLGKLSFSGSVTMRDDRMELGSAKIDLAPGSHLQVSGDANAARLSGQVNLRGAQISQDGVNARLGPGSAEIAASYSQAADGTLQIHTALEKLDATLEGFDLSRSRPDGKLDQLSLGQTQVKGGSLALDTRIKPDGNHLAVLKTDIRGSLQADGELKSAQLSIPDAKDDAEVRLGVGHFQGKLELAKKAIKLEGQVTDASVGVSDLQEKRAGASLSLHHANASGNAKVKIDTQAGTFDAQVQARSFDALVQDFRGTQGSLKLDVAPTSVQGSGSVSLSNAGVRATGDLKVKGGMDAVRVESKALKAQTAAGIQVDGRLKSLVAEGSDFSLEASANVAANLRGASFQMRDMRAAGAAQFTGHADVRVGPDGVFVTAPDGHLAVSVDDAKLGNGDLKLDVAAGSKLDVRPQDIAITGAGTKVKIGPGSVLDASLDSGRVKLGGQEMALAKGSRARLEVSSAQTTPQGVQLKGSLQLDAKVSADLGQSAGRLGFKVDQLPGEGRARITIPDVSLAPDGKLSLQDAQVQLDAKVGTFVAATSPQGAAVSAEQLPEGVRSPEAVQASSAAQLAGVDAPAATTFSPLQVAKKLKDGSLDLTIPLEGKVKAAGVTVLHVPNGTQLRLKAEVKDGQLVPDHTRVTVEGRAGALWMKLKGAYLDENNTVRLDIEGLPNFPVPKLGELPLDVDTLIDRLAPGHGSSPKSAHNLVSDPMDLVKLDRTALSIQDAAFKEGAIVLPGGSIDVDDTTRLSVKGGLQGGTVSGKVQLKNLEFAQDGVAIKGEGSAELKVDFKRERGSAKVHTELSNVSLATDYAVKKRANGDYIQLAKGQLEGGSLRAGAEVTLDAQGRPKGMKLGEVKLDITHFKGEVSGARVTVPDADGTAQVELGRSSVEGGVKIDGKRIELKAQVDELDVALRDFAAKQKGAAAKLEDARFVGRGKVELSTQKGLSFSAEAQGFEAVVSEAAANTSKASVAAGRTRIQGRGNVSLGADGELSLNGEMSSSSTVSAEVDVGSPKRPGRPR